jgi:hypothetical protein
MTNSSERKFSDVLDFTFSKDAKTLVFSTSAKSEDTNGIYVVTPQTDGAPVVLLSGKGKYQRLSWDEDNTELAFISDKDDVAAKQPRFKVYLWNRNDSPQLRSSQPHQRGFRKEYVISDKANLTFRSMAAICSWVRHRRRSRKEMRMKRCRLDEKVLVDLWHWKDDYIQPIQKVRAEQERNKSFRAVYNIKTKKFVQLADDTMESALHRMMAASRLVRITGSIG